MRILTYSDQLDMKSRIKCANFGLQESVIEMLLVGSKSHRKCANFGLQGSVIDKILAGLKSRRKYANFGLLESVIEGKKMHFQRKFSTGKKVIKSHRKFPNFCLK